MIEAAFAISMSLSSCGPDFPARLLADRAGTMSELVDGSFALEASRLVKPAHNYAVDETTEPAHAREQGGDAERALYDEGAVEFKRGDVEKAKRAWLKLLALPSDQRRNRSTWAAYMLGRVTQDASWFELTRKLVDDGFDDTLGLAVSSLGEQARFDLNRLDVEHAVALYAQQAALGSSSATSSLLMVARRLVKDDDALFDHVSDPLVQRLVAIYLYTRADEIDAAHTGVLLRAIEAKGVEHVAGADMLAAAAYRAGNYDVAARLAKVAHDTPLSTWVKAKLALRNGDEKEADAQLTSSRNVLGDEYWTSHFSDDGDEEVRPRNRVDAERAVIAMKEKRYADALTLLLRDGDAYWMDAAYVAERVMTTNELVAFVQQYAPSASPPRPTTQTWTPWVGEGRPPDRVRALLARRLMREHRYDEALPYFDEPTTRAAAQRYVDLLRRAGVHDERVVDVDAARALFDASKEMRTHGMEIAGTELDPDWSVFDGNYDLGDTSWTCTDEGGCPERIDVLTPKPLTAYVSDDEIVRARSSRVTPYARFHYRVVATELADHAADFVPPRSQAFAAMLCTATSWQIDRDPVRAQREWMRYVREGAIVDGIGVFGRDCPNPNFEKAHAMSLPSWHAKPMRKRVVARDVALLLLLVAAASIASRVAVRLTAARRTATNASP